MVRDHLPPFLPKASPLLITSPHEPLRETIFQPAGKTDEGTSDAIRGAMYTLTQQVSASHGMLGHRPGSKRREPLFPSRRCTLH
jgi:hypothetical protein